jgi:hypothetical protein
MSNQSTPLNSNQQSYIPKKILTKGDKRGGGAANNNANKEGAFKTKHCETSIYKEEFGEKNASMYNKINRQFSNEKIKSKELFYYSFSKCNIQNSNIITKTGLGNNN